MLQGRLPACCIRVALMLLCAVPGHVQACACTGLEVADSRRHAQGLHPAGACPGVPVTVAARMGRDDACMATVSRLHADRCGAPAVEWPHLALACITARGPDALPAGMSCLE